MPVIDLLGAFTVEYRSELSTRLYLLKLFSSFFDRFVGGNSVVAGSLVVISVVIGSLGFSVADSVVGEPLVSSCGSKGFASRLISVGGNSVISCSVVRLGAANLVVAIVTFA